MGIKEKVQEDRMAAMRSRDGERKGLLDYILGEIQKAEKDPHAKGDHGTAVIQAYVKAQRENIKEFTDSRPEEAARLQKEVDLLMEYMPKQMTEEEIRSAISELMASGVAGRGPIMAALKQKYGAALDGKRASEIAAEMGA